MLKEWVARRVSVGRLIGAAFVTCDNVTAARESRVTSHDSRLTTHDSLTSHSVVN